MTRKTGADGAGLDAESLRYYSANVAKFAEFADGLELEPRLLKFMDALPKDARVLELGCGVGLDAQAMLARGLDVDATDGCLEMAQEAERRLGRRVRVMLFTELDADGEYDGVWANAALLHVPREGLTDVLARVHCALKPGGLLYASFKTGRAEGRDKFGRYFNYPSREELAAFFSEAGDWARADVETDSLAGLDGTLSEWLHVFVRKA
jgi:SAM-dependent methyltransferase